jgi:capsular exopolysaccharide synthesis family protein
MSIIEEAVRKTAENHRRAPAESTSTYSKPRLRRVAPIAVEPAQSRRFQPLTLDDRVLEENHILPQIQDQSALRAYKILRTRILRRLDANQWRSFAVTGVTPGEGKTLSAINVAIALAQDVSTCVFLVDLDLQRPRLAHSLGITGVSGQLGLSDYLNGTAAMEDVIYSPGIERLAIIPNFEAVQNSSDLLTSPRMHELLQGLENETPRRIIIFDMPPVLASDDVLAFSPNVDSILLIVGEGTTDREAVTSAKEVLGEMNLLGVVLNRSSEANDSKYYGNYGKR